MPIIKKVVMDGDEKRLLITCDECDRSILICEDDSFCPLCFREIEKLCISAWNEYYNNHVARY